MESIARRPFAVLVIATVGQALLPASLPQWRTARVYEPHHQGDSTRAESMPCHTRQWLSAWRRQLPICSASSQRQTTSRRRPSYKEERPDDVAPSFPDDSVSSSAEARQAGRTYPTNELGRSSVLKRPYRQQSNDNETRRRPRLSTKPGLPRNKGGIKQTTIGINRRISREAQSAWDIISVYDENQASFQPVNYATALTWLAKRRPKRGYADGLIVTRILELAATTRTKLKDAKESWSARTLANACWASAKLYSSTSDDNLRRELVSCLDVLAARACHVTDEFKPQELSNVAWAMATASVETMNLTAALAKSAAPRIHHFSAQEMANLVWALARLFGPAIGDQKRHGEVSSTTLNLCPATFAAQQCATLYAAVCKEAMYRFHEFKPQELANTVWAIATTAFVPENEVEFWDAAVSAMGDKLQVAELSSGRPSSPAHEFAQPQNVANVVWSIAKVLPGGCSPDVRAHFFEIVARVSIESIDEFNPQELGNVAWSFATARESSDPLLDAIARAAKSKLPRFIPQNLANIVWAFATAGRGAPSPLDIDFFQAVARESIRRLSDFKSQELANTAWAFATAGVRCPHLFDALAKESAPRLSSFSDQGVANLAWAFSTSDEAVTHMDLFEAIADEAIGRVPNLLPQGLANLAWSYANADLRAPHLFDAIAVEIVGPGPATVSRRASQLKPQEFANLAWAFAKVNYSARPALYDALATGMLALAARHRDDLGAAGLTHQELANLAWAYACADHVDPALLGLLWRGVVERAKRTFAQNAGVLNSETATSNAVPVLTEHDYSATPFCRGDNEESEICSNGYDRDEDDGITAAWGFNLEERRQLQQVVLHARYEAKGQAAIVSDIARAPPAFLAVLRDALATVDSRASRSQLEVGETLQALGISVLEELVIPDGLSIDVALKPLSQRIGIEFDGPWHYFRNDPRVETGRTTFKKRLLTACGWTVLHIPYWEWGALDRTLESRKAYIKQKLTDLLLEKRYQATTQRKRMSRPSGVRLDLRRSNKNIDTSPTQVRAANSQAAREHGVDVSTHEANYTVHRESRAKDDRIVDELSSLKVSELRILCAQLGLDKTVRRSEGNARSVLIRRLRASLPHILTLELHRLS